MRRYYQMSPDEWLATSWDMQKTYLEYLAAEGIISFQSSEAEQLERLAEVAGGGPQIRQAETSAQVIDLAAMAAELRGA